MRHATTLRSPSLSTTACSNVATTPSVFLASPLLSFRHIPTSSLRYNRSTCHHFIEQAVAAPSLPLLFATIDMHAVFLSDHCRPPKSSPPSEPPLPCRSCSRRTNRVPIVEGGSPLPLFYSSKLVEMMQIIVDDLLDNFASSLI
jgi:hypothetical protein